MVLTLDDFKKLVEKTDLVSINGSPYAHKFEVDKFDMFNISYIDENDCVVETTIDLYEYRIELNKMDVNKDGTISIGSNNIKLYSFTNLGKELQEDAPAMVEIPKELYDRFNKIGLIPSAVNSANVGKSDYAEYLIQPWVIFNDHTDLSYQAADVIKRILRKKDGESRILDLKKCKHIIDELIRQEELKEK